MMPSVTYRSILVIWVVFFSL